MNVRPELTRIALYRLLADEGRLRLLTLAAEEELSVGELAELIEDSQSQISRRATPLRNAGLLLSRQEGTRIYLRAMPKIERDPVLRDALTEGRRLCMNDGSLARIAALVAARETSSNELFNRDRSEEAEGAVRAGVNRVAGSANTAYLVGLAPLIGRRQLAIDAGCGDGALLEILAPIYQRVFALDRSPAQLAKTANRIAQRGYSNVSLVESSYDDVDLIKRVDQLGGADLVYCARVLHHAARPAIALRACHRLLNSDGALIIVDYAAHHDEAMRQHGDIWLGFSDEQLAEFVAKAGLAIIASLPIARTYCPKDSVDAHLEWRATICKQAEGESSAAKKI